MAPRQWQNDGANRTANCHCVGLLQTAALGSNSSLRPLLAGSALSPARLAAPKPPFSEQGAPS